MFGLLHILNAYREERESRRYPLDVYVHVHSFSGVFYVRVEFLDEFHSVLPLERMESAIRIQSLFQGLQGKTS